LLDLLRYRLSRTFFSFRWRIKGIKVYALVGRTGSGKSFRSKLIMDKHGIDLLIDDGLLIRGQVILAGKSSKREKNRITAVKRAIFDDPDHIESVKSALKRERFKSILIIGTSEKMVARIAESLDLPYPDQTIYIEDVSTHDEIATARAHRRFQGKHVIPVPMVEVKKDPSQNVLDSIRFFLNTNPIFFWKEKTVEKTVVQPAFSRGHISVSESALSQMILHCVEEYDPRLRVMRILIDEFQQNIRVELRLQLPIRVTVPEILGGLQEYIIAQVERFSGIHIDELNLTVDDFQHISAGKKS